jgi:NAD(P)H-nitrite reductase large subunit
MQTSAPDVYAIGECCEIDGQTFGLVAPCLAQADILAARLAGDVTAPFALTDNGMRLKVTGVELFSLGRAAEQEGDVVWSAWDPLTRHYRRLLIHQGALAGVLLMGDCRSGGIYRFTGNGCARARGLAVRSFHYATAGCRTERYDKTYSGGGWARYGRPSFSRRLR